MAIDDNTSYELTGYQVKDLASKVRGKADSSSLASVATSGLYSDLTGKPTIPTVNNGTLTLVQNGTTVGTFTANQSTNTTVNLAGGVYADDPTAPANPNAWITSSDIDWSTIEYSTTEQVVGKWIDGRLVYRKVLAGTTNYNNSEDIIHGITNFGVALNIYGYIHASNGESQPIPRVVPDNISGYGIGVGDINSTRIAFQHPSGNYKGRPYAIIMEYIKTS